MKKGLIAFPALIAISLWCGSLAAQQNEKSLETLIEETIRMERDLDGAVVAIAVKDLGGRSLVNLNANLNLVPASNTKLITTGTALHALGGDWRFETLLGYSGKVENGVLEGDVYIIGRGDPTTGAKDSIATGTDVLFARWNKMLQDEGIRKIDGSIVGDGSWWDGMPEHGSWTYEDIGTYYGAGADALCFYKNAVDFRISAAAEGQPVNLTQSYPETPWMTLENKSFTGPAGTGNSLYMYTTCQSTAEELRGSFAIDRRPKTEHFANKYGALTCAYYFARYLGVDSYKTGRFESGKVIGSTQSATLNEIVKITNHNSDNFYAEAIYRAMGKLGTGSAVYDSCRVARNEVLEDLSLKAPKLVDGSGLSRENLLCAEYLADFLVSMTHSPAFPDFLASIPEAGKGTLRTMKPNSRLRLKSGSMGGVLCYSGYILDECGTPVAVVSLLANGITAPDARARRAHERILNELFLSL